MSGEDNGVPIAPSTTYAVQDVATGWICTCGHTSEDEARRCRRQLISSASLIDAKYAPVYRELIKEMLGG